jgi:hypothetical protein
VATDEGEATGNDGGRSTRQGGRTRSGEEPVVCEAVSWFQAERKRDPEYDGATEAKPCGCHRGQALRVRVSIYRSETRVTTPCGGGSWRLWLSWLKPGCVCGGRVGAIVLRLGWSKVRRRGPLGHAVEVSSGRSFWGAACLAYHAIDEYGLRVRVWAEAPFMRNAVCAERTCSAMSVRWQDPMAALAATTETASSSCGPVWVSLFLRLRPRSNGVP